MFSLTTPTTDGFVPTVQGDSSGGTDWGSLILLGNDIAMQWYSMTQDKPIPEPVRIPGTAIPTQTYKQTLLIFGVIAIAAILILKK